MSADDATREARRDLARLNYPPADWVLPRHDSAGRRMLDVLVVGAERARKNPTCARYPCVGPGYELLPRAGADATGLARVRVFDWSAMLSHGTQGGDIPGLELGAVRLAAAVAGDLFLEDAPAHEAKLRAYDEDELAATRLGAVPEVRADS